MKYIVVLLIVSWIQSASATNLRALDAPIRATTRHTVAAAKNISASCPHQQAALAVQPGHSSVTSIKLRFCNAVTIERKSATTVFHNGKELHANPIESRKCAEFVIPIEEANTFEVKLTGQVVAGWSDKKSKADMVKTPILFLVASVFGEGADTTFTVDEFHGEDNGLKQVQVAFMDVLRGAPDARLRLVSSGGEFEMGPATFVSICAGEYSLHFVEPGQPVREMNQKASFTVGEQYVVLRLAAAGPAPKQVKTWSGGGGSSTKTVESSKSSSAGSTPTETTMVYPQTGSGGLFGLF